MKHVLLATAPARHAVRLRCRRPARHRDRPAAGRPAWDRAGLRTLDTEPAVTVFATSDEMLSVFPFPRIPVPWDNPPALAQLLRQAVLAERLTPDRLTGTHQTLTGTQAVITMDSGGPRVNGLTIRCRQLDTTNAAVSIVDDLLPQR